MKFYRLSEQRVRGIINSPKRVEQGIAPATTAAMQGVGSKNHPYEIWVMFRKATKNKQQETRIISAWRYPGITKPGEPLPEKILQEISEIEKLKD